MNPWNGASAAVILISASAMAAAPVPSDRPNILLVVIDDLGCHDLGGEGHPAHLTPAMDRLAGESLRFTEAFCNGPNFSSAYPSGIPEECC